LQVITSQDRSLLVAFLSLNPILRLCRFDCLPLHVRGRIRAAARQWDHGVDYGWLAGRWSKGDCDEQGGTADAAGTKRDGGDGEGEEARTGCELF